MLGIFGLDDLHGIVLRTAVSRSRMFDEKFMVSFDLDLPSERLLPFHGAGATLIDERPFVEVPSEGVSLLYCDSIVSNLTREKIIAAFEMQKVPDPVADAAVADYSTAKPLHEEDFWALLEPLRSTVDSDSIEVVVARVSMLPKSKILSFARRFFDLLAQLSTPEIMARNPQSGDFPGDSFLWWRLAVLAGGHELTDRVLAGESGTQIEDDDWTGAEEMVDLCERAWEIRTGVRPMFSNGPVPVGEPVKAADRREYVGPRAFQAMIDDDRFPQIVGSRFLVDVGGQLSDCVAIQLVDIHSEDREDVLARLAGEVATRLGGQVASLVLGCNTYTGKLYDGLGAFRSKTPST